MQTIDGNIEGFTKEQVQGAFPARELYHNLHRPPLEYLKNMVRAGQIRDNPVSLKAIESAELIFGPDIATLKGQTVRKKPPPVTEMIHAVPTEMVEPHRDLPAAMDEMTICGLRYLAFVDLTIRNRMAPRLKTNSRKEFFQAIDQIFDFYNGHGFHIAEI